MFVVLKHILSMHFCDLQSGSGYCWGEGGCTLQCEVFLPLWPFFFMASSLC